MNGFFTATRAARAIGVSRQTVHNMINDKRISAVRMLEQWAVPESEVVRVKGERAQRRKKAPKKAKK